MSQRISSSNAYYSSNDDDFGIRIHGQPYHKSTEELSSFYASSSTEVYLRSEAASAIGDYALVDSTEDSTIIVTSPAFCGGYFQTQDGITVGRTLQTVLSNIPREKISLSARGVEFYLNHWQRPISTMFEGVRRLPPGCVLEIREGSVVDLDCYADRGESHPDSFSEAIERSLSPLAEVSKKDIILMYSGGVDSTAFYSALKNTIGEDRFEAVTVDIGSNTNSVERAQTVGNQVGISPRVVDFGWPPKDSDVLSIIEDQLAEGFTDPLSPHWAFHSADGDNLVLSGQNMDAMMTGGMHRPQVSYLNHLRTTKDILSVVKGWAENMQYTHTYEESQLLQRLYSRFVPRILDPDYTGVANDGGYYLGGLSTGHPNFVDDFAELASAELRHIESVLATAEDQRKGDLINYLRYQQNGSQTIGTFVSENAELHLPSMWGPLLSYCSEARRGLSDALSPKREVYRYVESQTGEDYRKIAYRSRNQHQRLKDDESRHQRSMESELLKNNIEYFDSERSHVLSLVPELSNQLVDEYAGIESEVSSGVSFSTLKQAHKILNLELILDRALSSE